MPAGTLIALCIGLGAAGWHFALGGHWSGGGAWPALFVAWHWSQVAGRARFGRLDLKRPRLWAASLALWLPMPLLWHCATGGDRVNALHGLAAVVLAGCAIRSWTLLRAVAGSGERPAVAAVRIAAIPFAVGACVALAHSPTGDEPHYLRITQSLLAHGTVELSAQLAGEPGGLVAAAERLHGARRVAPDGSISWISQHLPGLPVVLLPGYALAGRVGAVATMALLGGLCVLLATAWCRQSGADPVAALAGGLLAGLGVPVASYATALFPELPAAVAALTAACAMRNDRHRRPVLAALALALLPWLNVRYVALGLPLGVWALWRARRSPSQIIPLVVIPALSLGLLAHYVHWATGSYDPASLYPGMGGLFDRLTLGRWIQIASGLLFDHRVGLLVLAPVWWMAVHGMARTAAVAGLPLACTATLITLGAVDWDGSFSPPARLLACALPVAAPVLAHAWDGIRSASATGRAVLVVLVLFAAGQTIAALSNPGLAWSDSGHQPTLLLRGAAGLLPDWDEGCALGAAILRTLPLLALGVAGVVLTRPRRDRP